MLKCVIAWRRRSRRGSRIAPMRCTAANYRPAKYIDNGGQFWSLHWSDWKGPTELLYAHAHTRKEQNNKNTETINNRDFCCHGKARGEPSRFKPYRGEACKFVPNYLLPSENTASGWAWLAPRIKEFACRPQGNAGAVQNVVLCWLLNLKLVTANDRWINLEREHTILQLFGSLKWLPAHVELELLLFYIFEIIKKNVHSRLLDVFWRFLVVPLDWQYLPPTKKN